jgi:hypothetical protein
VIPYSSNTGSQLYHRKIFAREVREQNPKNVPRLHLNFHVLQLKITCFWPALTLNGASAQQPFVPLSHVCSSSSCETPLTHRSAA